MKAIALHRPWADWVVLGLKSIETRKHAQFKGLVGQTIAIYATKTWEGSAITTARRVYLGDLDELAKITEERKAMNLGAHVIGTTFVTAGKWLTDDDLTQSMAMIECASIKRFGLFLDDSRTIDPLEVRGMQGIFNVELP